MKFEFDPTKSASNKAKHGIDFVEAQALWSGWTIEIPATTSGAEVRYAVLGAIGGKAYTAIVTYRGTTRRIISVRGSTKPEAEYYASQKPKD